MTKKVLGWIWDLVEGTDTLVRLMGIFFSILLGLSTLLDAPLGYRLFASTTHYLELPLWLGICLLVFALLGVVKLIQVEGKMLWDSAKRIREKYG